MGKGLQTVQNLEGTDTLEVLFSYMSALCSPLAYFSNSYGLMKPFECSLNGV